MTFSHRAWMAPWSPIKTSSCRQSVLWAVHFSCIRDRKRTSVIRIRVSGLGGTSSCVPLKLFKYSWKPPSMSGASDLPDFRFSLRTVQFSGNKFNQIAQFPLNNCRLFRGDPNVERRHWDITCENHSLFFPKNRDLISIATDLAF